MFYAVCVKKFSRSSQFCGVATLRCYTMIMLRSSLVSDFLEKHGTVTVPQPPYLLDLTPADYFMFPKLKVRLKGRRFQVIKNIKKE